MKLSELKASQMVSVAVKDGRDSFFKITFVISLSQKKKHDLSHFWYVSKRPVIIRRPGKAGRHPGEGGFLERGGLGGFCLRHDKIHLTPSHRQLSSSQFFVVPPPLYFGDECCPSVPPENHVIHPQIPLPLALGCKL